MKGSDVGSARSAKRLERQKRIERRMQMNDIEPARPHQMIKLLSSPPAASEISSTVLLTEISRPFPTSTIGTR